MSQARFPPQRKHQKRHTSLRHRIPVIRFTSCGACAACGMTVQRLRGDAKLLGGRVPGFTRGGRGLDSPHRGPLE